MNYPVFGERHKVEQGPCQEGRLPRQPRMIQLRQLWKNDREGTHLVDGQVLLPLLSVDQAFLWHHKCTESLIHQSEK